jgi:hypothetical protein
MLSLPRERASAGVLGYRAGRGERICRGVAPTPHKKGPDQRGLAGLVRYVVKEGCWALPKMVRRAFGHAPGWPFALQQSPPGGPSAQSFRGTLVRMKMTWRADGPQAASISLSFAR